MNICDKSNQMRNYIFDKDYKEIPFLFTRNDYNNFMLVN